MWMSCITCNDIDRTNLSQWSKDDFTKMYVLLLSHSQSLKQRQCSHPKHLSGKIGLFGCWCRNYTLDDQWKVHLIGGNILISYIDTTTY